MSATYNPQLDTFLRVADAGSFNKAAEEMMITSTAVIKQINLLENGLGVSLFIRSHRGLELTEAGKSLLSDAKYIVSYCKESARRAQKAARRDSTLIRIGTSAMTPSQFLLSFWPHIHKACPDIRFELVSFENTPENARGILGNLGKHIDIVPGVYDDAFLESRGCGAQLLSRERICLAVPVTHPLAVKDRIEIGDLYGERLMLIQRGWNSEVDALRADLVKQHPAVQIIDFDFLSVQPFSLCEQEGCVMMTLPCWENVHALLKVIPVNWEYQVNYGIFHAINPSPAVKRLLDAARVVIGL